MAPVSLGLFFSALLLQEAAALQRARCSGNLCCFQGSLDSKAAQEACEGQNGQLVQSSTSVETSMFERLLRGFTGVFWLQGGPNCTAVSAGSGPGFKVRPEHCGDILDGFFCTFGSSEVCGVVRDSGNTSVTYRSRAGLEFADSETFPPGTLALAARPGAQFPDSKYLCVSNWMQAPWNCEVLQGGCDHSCDQFNHTCTCPAAQSLHHNSFSCTNTSEPGSSSPSEIRRCSEGYRPAEDGKSCVDVDECADEKNACLAKGEACVNLDGGYKCDCAEGFSMEEGACVNISICRLCEHMDCAKISGVYQCKCREGYRVSPKDPTKCEQVCNQKTCPAICHPNPKQESKDTPCFCPEGFILDRSEGAATCHDFDECEAQMLCDHECENLFGGFRCVCRKGYTLQKEKCVRMNHTEEDEDEEDASGSPPPPPPAPSTTPVSLQPAALPSYIKTGSVLGITVFLALCGGGMLCVVRYAARRCRTLDLTALKHPDIDIFYLQQVTTETYKRLSFDKQVRNEPQRV